MNNFSNTVLIIAASGLIGITVFALHKNYTLTKYAQVNERLRLENQKIQLQLELNNTMYALPPRTVVGGFNPKVA
jgi:hypothetical protein